MAGDPKNCKAEAGVFRPVINRNKCEAKGPCVPACPYGVLEILALTPVEKSGLSFFGKLKAMAHGNKQAHVVKAATAAPAATASRSVPKKPSR